MSTPTLRAPKNTPTVTSPTFVATCDRVTAPPTRSTEGDVPPTRVRRLSSPGAAAQSGVHPLPGSKAQDNCRPLRVGAAYDGQALGAFLTQRHPHVPVSAWEEKAAAGCLLRRTTPLPLSAVVRAGDELTVVTPNEVEPPVSLDVRWIFEDDHMVVLQKPAPLPVHPCGRFLRNSLTELFKYAFDMPPLKPVHRLDADTSGILVLAKTREAARGLGRQFEMRTVRKTYLALAAGAPPDSSTIDCKIPIGAGPVSSGKRLAAQQACGAQG